MKEKKNVQNEKEEVEQEIRFQAPFDTHLQLVFHKKRLFFLLYSIFL
jgi:hypothetical protein